MSGIKKRKLRYTYEEVYEIFKDKGYELLDKEYVNNKTKMTYEDKDGYRYETAMQNSHKKQSMATKSNKWTLYNIQRYLEINNETCVLKSTEFKNQNTPLDWVCENGHEFHTNWNGFYTKGSRCLECENTSRMYTFEQCEEVVSKRDGYKLQVDSRKIVNDSNKGGLYNEH